MPEQPLPVADEAAPLWRAGDWWEWEFTSGAHAPMRTKVVAVPNADGTFSFGTPDLDAAFEAQPFHTLPLGLISGPGIGWVVHGNRYTFVELPLTAGRTWTSDVWFAKGVRYDVNATTLDVPGGPSAGFEMVGRDGNGGISLITNWSSAWNQIASIDVYFGGTAPFSQSRLVDAGHNFTGTVHVPTVSDLYVLRAAANNPQSLAPATFTVGSGLDRLVLACFMGGAPGHYEASLTDPGGGQTGCQSDETGSSGTVTLKVSHASATSGTWTIAGRPLGPAGVLAEVVGVAVEDRVLA